MVGNPCSNLYLLRTLRKRISLVVVVVVVVVVICDKQKSNLVVKCVVEHLMELLLGQIGVGVEHLVALHLDDVRFDSPATQCDQQNEAGHTGSI